MEVAKAADQFPLETFLAKSRVGLPLICVEDRVGSTEIDDPEVEIPAVGKTWVERLITGTDDDEIAMHREEPEVGCSIRLPDRGGSGNITATPRRARQPISRAAAPCPGSCPRAGPARAAPLPRDQAVVLRWRRTSSSAAAGSCRHAAHPDSDRDTNRRRRSDRDCVLRPRREAGSAARDPCRLR